MDYLVVTTEYVTQQFDIFLSIHTHMKCGFTMNKASWHSELVLRQIAEVGFTNLINRYSLVKHLYPR